MRKDQWRSTVRTFFSSAFGLLVICGSVGFAVSDATAFADTAPRIVRFSCTYQEVVPHPTPTDTWKFGFNLTAGHLENGTGTVIELSDRYVLLRTERVAYDETDYGVIQIMKDSGVYVNSNVVVNSTGIAPNDFHPLVITGKCAMVS